MQIIVFRHQLFKISEPFIMQQASELKQFQPIYLGRECFGARPDNSLTLAIEDMPEQRSFLRKLWQVLTRDPKPYLHLLKSKQPSLVHAHFGVEGVYALPLARKLDIPLVTTFHGFDATTSIKSLIMSGSPAWINYALFRNKLAKEGDLFICVSEYIRQRVIELGYPENKTYVHYIGINTDNIVPRLQSEETSTVLHVARLVEKKGTEYLIRAFAKISAKHPGVKLIILGDGPLRTGLEKLVLSLGVQNQVSFLGPKSHSEVLKMMQQASIIAVPSVTAKTGDTEGLPIVILEAMAIGVPVIGTLHSGIPEAIEDGISGFLVPERNVGMLADKLSCLLINKDLRNQMGIQARQVVESRFDIRKQTEKLEALYMSVLS